MIYGDDGTPQPIYVPKRSTTPLHHTNACSAAETHLRQARAAVVQLHAAPIHQWRVEAAAYEIETLIGHVRDLTADLVAMHAATQALPA